jgi:hypothetical protein
MNPAAEAIRHNLDHSVDQLSMILWNAGFESALNAIDELSNELHNTNDTMASEILRWAAKELRGENAEAN